MKDNKGFTLIELLAVIVILGVLLTIATPKVSQYITNSKKDGFISTAKLIINSVRNDATSELIPLPIQRNDVTVVTFDSVSLNKAQAKSSFGGNYIYNKSYVAIINVGDGTNPEYLYFFAAQDSKDYAIPLTLEKELSSKLVVAKAKNKMEVTIQSLCGTPEGSNSSTAILKGLEEYQPSIDGRKSDWNVTVYSKDGCQNEE